MTTETQRAMDDAREAAEEGFTNRFVEGLAEKIGGYARIQAAFGEPIERAGLTVVPVARVRWGFGGGAGSGGETPDNPGGGSGSGGGGAASVEPIGYLEIRPDGATFRQIVPPYPNPLFLLAAGLTGALILRALARLIRG